MQLGSDSKWQKRRFRHLKTQYGVKTDAVAEELHRTAGAETLSDLGEPLSPLDFTDPRTFGSVRSVRSRRGVQDARLRVERRDSVAKIAYETFNSLVQGDTFRKPRRRFGEQTDDTSSHYTSIRVRNQLAGNRSFPSCFRDGIGSPTAAPSNLEVFSANGSRWPTDKQTTVTTDDSTPFKSFPDVPVARFVKGQDDAHVEFGMFAAQDSLDVKSPAPKTSTARKRPLKAQDSVPQGEFFFDFCASPFAAPALPEAQALAGKAEPTPAKTSEEFAPTAPYFHLADERVDVDFAGVPGFLCDSQLDRPSASNDASRQSAERRPVGVFHRALIEKDRAASTNSGPAPTSTLEKMRTAAVNAGRRSWKRPDWWSDWFGGSRRNVRPRSLPIIGKFKRDRSFEPPVVMQLENENLDYRPFFTYWITTVQIIITVCSLLIYGIGTDFTRGFGVIERSGDVLASTLSSVHIVVWEQNNVWVGPRFADLVHMGAKFSPCMRADPRILQQIDEERRIESTRTGCCVGPDQKCFQTSTCPKQFATFTQSLLIRRKKQPVVCGQDPRYCKDPKSYEWGSDVSKWPRCQDNAELIPRRESHMHCELAGRPCCIQMHGQCRITTHEYCDFVRGYFHANATLCSQVSCLNDVCGMTPFLQRDAPDQFYRLFIPLFIHAGILRLAITVYLQMTIMRRFELMIGCARLSLIYFVSGVGGYLASASFVPYMPEVGPAGSQGGVLGALIINVLYNWRYLKEPRRVLLQHLALAAGLFITGLLPFIDNWAQLFGFVFGILMAAALIPYIDFGNGTRLVLVVSSLLITILLFTFLVFLFYGLPVLDVPVLSLFNCPFFDNKVCDQQGLILRNWLPI